MNLTLKNKYYFGILLVLITSIACSLPQAKTNLSDPIEENDNLSKASQQKLVTGTIHPINVVGNDIEQVILSQPLPEIQIALTEGVTQNDNTTKLTPITAETQNILYRHWLNTLRHRYLTEIREKSPYFDYRKEDVSLIESTINTKNELLKTSVSHTEASRRFNQDEAQALVAYIKDASGEVLNEIKKLKNPN